ncbi:hypothetical protein MCETARE7_00029 [Candidatus Nanopelagicaceae bacterium]
MTAPWSGLNNYTAKPNVVGELTRQYPGIRILAESPSFFGLTEHYKVISSKSHVVVPKSLENSYPIKQCNNLSNTLSQLHSIQNVLQFYETHPTKNDSDFLILTRFDCLILNLPKLRVPIDKSVLYLSDKHDSFPDLFMMGNLSQLKATNPLPVIEQVMKTTPNLHGEKLKQIAFALQSNGGATQPVHILHYALRSDGLFEVIVQILRELVREIILHNRKIRKLLSSAKNKLITFRRKLR